MVAPFVPGHRLSTVLGNSLPIDDQAGVAVLHYTPHRGNNIALFNTVSQEWIHMQMPALSKNLGCLIVGKPYDIFIRYNSGQPDITLVEWASSIERAVELATQDDFFVQASDHSRLYVGTIVATSGNTTEDSRKSRYVYNHFNQVPRFGRVEDPTAHVTTNGQEGVPIEWRTTGGIASTRMHFVLGHPQEVIAHCQADLNATGMVNACEVTLGLDGTVFNPNTFGISLFGQASGQWQGAKGYSDCIPIPAGAHFISCMEWPPTVGSGILQDGLTVVQVMA